MRQRWLLLVFPLAPALYVACGDDSSGRGGSGGSDASIEASTEAGADDGGGDAEAGLTGDPCGDRSGLVPNAAWPMAGGCPKRGGSIQISGPRTTTIRFRARLPAPSTSPVVDADGTVHVATADGRLVTVDLGGGVTDAGAGPGVDAGDAGDASDDGGASDAGAADASGSDASTTAGTSIAIGKDGQLVYGESDGKAYAFALPPATSWSHALATPLVSSPVIGPSGNVYVSAGGTLYALALGSGTSVWMQSTHDVNATSSPALADGELVLVGSADKHVYAFDKAGAARWTFPTAAPVVATAGVLVDREGTVIAADQGGTVYALDAATGKERWHTALGSPIVSGCAAGLDAAIFCGSSNGKVYALEPTGKSRWTYATQGANTAPIVDNDGVVYVGSDDGHLYAIAPSGKLRFAVTTGPIHAQPAMGLDGAIYVTTDTELVGIGP